MHLARLHRCLQEPEVEMLVQNFQAAPSQFKTQKSYMIINVSNYTRSSDFCQYIPSRWYGHQGQEAQKQCWHIYVHAHINAKGVCLLSVLFPDNILRALREKDVDQINYTGDICLLINKQTKAQPNSFLEQIQGTKGSDMEV